MLFMSHHLFIKISYEYCEYSKNNNIFDDIDECIRARNDYTLYLKESSVIQLYKFILNKNVQSMPLHFFG